MKCEQVQALLVSYLNHETTPSERALIQAHCSGCTACQEEMSLLSATQGQISAVLQRRADQAAPAKDAWERLEARLTEAAQPSPMNFGTRPGMGRITQLFSGGVTMRKRLTFSALVAVLALSIVGVYMAKTVTRVSAKEILDRAYAAQATETPSLGIQHTKVETYTNFQALPEDQGTTTILESYGDLQSGNFRNVTIDNKTGQVLDAFAYDGTYTYSQDYSQASGQVGNNTPLTIYRTPQENASVADLKLRSNSGEMGAKDIFELMRNDPNVQLVGQETWADGRTVYVLQSQQMKVPVYDEAGKPTGLVNVYPDVNNGAGQPTGLMTMYFEVNTYEYVGTRETLQKDGQEVVIRTQKILVDETLPEGTSVAWDLSDVQGITIVDDPNREHGDLLPEVVPSQELPTKTQNGYLLKNVPNGYTLEITAPPKQPANEPYIYIASYRTAANDYFVIQAASPADVEAMTTAADETYTTASGLVMHFVKDISDPSGKQYTSAIVEAPNGVAFMINSTLPRETVKVWAEDLVLAK